MAAALEVPPLFEVRETPAVDGRPVPSLRRRQERRQAGLKDPLPVFFVVSTPILVLQCLRTNVAERSFSFSSRIGLSYRMAVEMQHFAPFWCITMKTATRSRLDRPPITSISADGTVLANVIYAYRPYQGVWPRKATRMNPPVTFFNSLLGFPRQ